MRGGMNAQVTHLFNASGIFKPGESKHSAKRIARENGAGNWAEMGKNTDLYGYKSAETYKGVWHEFAQYARREMGLKDLEKVKGEHVGRYLEWKAETVAKSTFDKICSAMAKFENVLNGYSEVQGKDTRYELRSTIFETKDQLRDSIKEGDGRDAYRDPLIVGMFIEEPKHQIAAAIQLEGGARIGGVDKIEARQLLGINDEGRGVIFQEKFNAKGGRGGVLHVSSETYRALESVVAREGSFKVDRDRYRADIRQACTMVGEKYQGSHGFRHNFARASMERLMREGNTYEKALCMTSNLMFHSRPDIVEHYLP
jgi:hypothetical protein